jgi:ssDNA-binding Zn-finger/Zn-ribbon topoisomerase 1
MPKRRYISEDDAEEESCYRDSQCPNCGASLRLRFRKGRRTRRIHCPVCKETGTVSLEADRLSLPVLDHREGD